MKQLIITVILTATSWLTVNAQIDPVDNNGIAIGGYDVVAYFSNGATKGNSKIATKHDGAIYRFASAENRQKFLDNPDKYLPQFGGYCAWGVAAKEAKFPSNPETYDIIDGKLYLFFDGPFGGKPFDSAQLWEAETTQLKAAAHQNWPKVKNK